MRLVPYEAVAGVSTVVSAREIDAPDNANGLAEFGGPSNGLFGWVDWRDGAVEWGRGRAPRSPDVTVSFGNEQIALAALRGELDELAAIGAGDLVVRGQVPLAETLGAAMARADVYLERRSAKTAKLENRR